MQQQQLLLPESMLAIAPQPPGPHMMLLQEPQQMMMQLPLVAAAASKPWPAKDSDDGLAGAGDMPGLVGAGGGYSPPDDVPGRDVLQPRPASGNGLPVAEVGTAAPVGDLLAADTSVTTALAAAAAMTGGSDDGGSLKRSLTGEQDLGAGGGPSAAAAAAAAAGGAKRPCVVSLPVLQAALLQQQQQQQQQQQMAQQALQLRPQGQPLMPGSLMLQPQQGGQPGAPMAVLFLPGQQQQIQQLRQQQLLLQQRQLQQHMQQQQQGMAQQAPQQQQQQQPLSGGGDASAADASGQRVRQAPARLSDTFVAAAPSAASKLGAAEVCPLIVPPAGSGLWRVTKERADAAKEMSAADAELLAQRGVGKRGRGSTTSTFRGVTQHRRSRRWEAHIWMAGKQVYLGSFDSDREAAMAHDLTSVRFFGGRMAVTNFCMSNYESECASLDVETAPTGGVMPTPTPIAQNIQAWRDVLHGAPIKQPKQAPQQQQQQRASSSSGAAAGTVWDRPHPEKRQRTMSLKMLQQAAADDDDDDEYVPAKQRRGAAPAGHSREGSRSTGAVRRKPKPSQRYNPYGRSYGERYDGYDEEEATPPAAPPGQLPTWGDQRARGTRDAFASCRDAPGLLSSLAGQNGNAALTAAGLTEELAAAAAAADAVAAAAGPDGAAEGGEGGAPPTTEFEDDAAELLARLRLRRLRSKGRGPRCRVPPLLPRRGPRVRVPVAERRARVLARGRRAAAEAAGLPYFSETEDDSVVYDEGVEGAVFDAMQAVLVQLESHSFGLSTCLTELLMDWADVRSSDAVADAETAAQQRVQQLVDECLAQQDASEEGLKAMRALIAPRLAAQAHPGSAAAEQAAAAADVAAAVLELQALHEQHGTALSGLEKGLKQLQAALGELLPAPAADAAAAAGDGGGVHTQKEAATAAAAGAPAEAAAPAAGTGDAPASDAPAAAADAPPAAPAAGEAAAAAEPEATAEPADEPAAAPKATEPAGQLKKSVAAALEHVHASMKLVGVAPAANGGAGAAGATGDGSSEQVQVQVQAAA